MWFLLGVSCSEYAIDGQKVEPEAPEPDIQIEPTSVRFDTLAPGCALQQTVLVRNVGEAPLNVSGSWIEGDGTLTADWLEQTIGSGEAVPVTVHFQPTGAGAVIGSLVVPSDDPDEPQASAGVEGLSDPEVDVIDAWLQDTRPVDVLWVIDNSGSMAQEQARVIADIEEFYTWFDTLGLDYHMGVVTTDIVTPTMGGRLQGTPAYITPDTPNGIGELTEALNVGTEDQGDESGLAGMRLALSEPVLSGENAGFYRPDAQLVVSFLTDEPEQSGVASSEYITFLQGLKADPSWVLVSAIVGERDLGCSTTCDGAANDAQPGNAYLDVVEAFSGVFGSICTCDLSTILADIGLESTLYARAFDLSTFPASSADIHVYVDGIETWDWTYDAERNAIVFPEPPLDGARIEILYPADRTCPDGGVTDDGDTGDTGAADTGTPDTGTSDSG